MAGVGGGRRVGPARLRRELEHHVVAVALARDLPLLFVDGLLLEQVLVNLVENAARYTPAGSRIELSARPLTQPSPPRGEGSNALPSPLGGEGRVRGVEIRVADDGPGLPPGSEARIFDKFFRGTTRTTDGRRGVGLGLAICQAIIEAHKGRISAGNRPGGGAEFIISLPCEEPSPQIALEEVTAKTDA